MPARGRGREGAQRRHTAAAEDSEEESPREGAVGTPGAAEAVTIEIQSEWFTKPPGNAAAKEWAASVLAGPFRAKVLAETTAFVEALAIK